MLVCDIFCRPCIVLEIFMQKVYQTLTYCYFFCCAKKSNQKKALFVKMNLLNRLRLFRFGQHFDNKERTPCPLI